MTDHKRAFGSQKERDDYLAVQIQWAVRRQHGSRRLYVVYGALFDGNQVFQTAFAWPIDDIRRRPRGDFLKTIEHHKRALLRRAFREQGAGMIQKYDEILVTACMDAWFDLDQKARHKPPRTYEWYRNYVCAMLDKIVTLPDYILGNGRDRAMILSNEIDKRAKEHR